MNDVQVCFRHVSSMLQVQAYSGMFQVYVTSLCCYKLMYVTSLSLLQVQGCYKFFDSRALVPYVIRASCHMFQGLIATMFMLQD